MTLDFTNLPIPLHTDPHGTIRVGGTRVTLETVIGAFQRGATPEEIVQDFSSLQLADVYAVIAFYLKNREDVDAYLDIRQKQGEAIRREMEKHFDPTGIRERLLARRKDQVRYLPM